MIEFCLGRDTDESRLGFSNLALQTPLPKSSQRGASPTTRRTTPRRERISISVPAKTMGELAVVMGLGVSSKQKIQKLLLGERVYSLSFRII